MRSCAPLFLLLFALVAAVSAQDTVVVSAGWNIIGSLAAGAVPEVLTTIPDSIISTSFFGYAPGVGYQSTDTLGKGLGYWVKVSTDGIIIFEGSPFAGCGVTRVDYGGFSYGTVPIGSQCWLDENLNVGMMVTGVTGQTNNATLEKYCYDNDSANCVIYGGLYQWDEAMQYDSTEGAQGLCPAGWHIPTQTEFQTLSNTVSGDGNALKKGGVGSGDGLGTNTSGFSGLLAGRRFYFNGSFTNFDGSAAFWSSTDNDAALGGFVSLYKSTSSLDFSYDNKSNGFSVRCLED